MNEKEVFDVDIEIQYDCWIKVHTLIKHVFHIKECLNESNT